LDSLGLRRGRSRRGIGHSGQQLSESTIGEEEKDIKKRNKYSRTQ